jgi:hypothetical protein
MAITLPYLQTVVSQIAAEIQAGFPDTSFSYAGIMLIEETPYSRYDSTPLNAKIFALTGGDGVHYSILELSDSIQPVIMTVPMAYGDSMSKYNWILGENLTEFLSLGYYNGWFSLEQLAYNQAAALAYFACEDPDAECYPTANTHFIRNLRTKLGYNHVPLNMNRLEELNRLYFDKIEFDPDFAAEVNGRKNR